MNYSNFIESLTKSQAPENLSIYLQALWWEAKGNWDKAHSLVEHEHSGNGAWIHGYLHRVEGDEWNAGYWYRKASKSFPQSTLKAEWEEIARTLLESK